MRIIQLYTYGGRIVSRVLILGSGAQQGSLATLLSRSHQVGATDASTPNHGKFIEDAKHIDLFFLWGDESRSRVLADDIWHLLRNKLIVSLIPSFSLGHLKDMYPLSKVARCKLCIDGAVDRALFIFTTDRSYSDRDTAILRGAAGASGEVLFVPENIFESLTGQVDASRTVLEAVQGILKESMGQDRDLYSFVLDWILYGMGSAGISGETPAESKHGESFAPSDMGLLREAVNGMLNSHNRGKPTGGA
jgi:hypothetical protein